MYQLLPNVQLPTPADNVALLVATTERQLCRAYGPQQQTRRTLLQRSTDGTDRQAYGRTPYRYIDPTAYYASSVHNKSTWYTLAATFGTERIGTNGLGNLNRCTD